MALSLAHLPRTLIRFNVSHDNQQPNLAEKPAVLPTEVTEELNLLRIVLSKLDAQPARLRSLVDDAGTLIELRDALAEAKPEDQGPLMAEMHRIEALSRQRGKGDSPPVDRRSPYFAHLRLLEGDKRRDVLIGQRGFVERGGGVQIVDWRNAPVSRLFYRYEEGDCYEEQLGDRVVEGEVLARRTVSIINSELRRVACDQGTWSRAAGSDEWRAITAQQIRLSVGRDGFPKTALPEPDKPTAVKHDGRGPARLGLEADGSRRRDRFLPAIAALIDPRQFDLISRPSSGLIVVQGTAGSGKTTIGLHRIAYLAFADPQHFRPKNMLVVVYQRALANYVSQVLPSLDVPGVPVRTFGSWSKSMRRSMFPSLEPLPGDGPADTPPVVMRAKSHGAMLKILQERQVEKASWCRAELESALDQRPELPAVLVAWDETRGAVDARVTALARWVKQAALSAAARTAIENVGARLRARTRDVVGEWAALLTDRKGLAEGLARHAPGVFSEGQIDTIHRWCVGRERLRQTRGQGDEGWALDQEDDALLLRLYQMQRGPLGNKEPILYDHLMVDEVQDFAPIELAVLLDSTNRHRSITLAGDTNQAIMPEHGFSDWTQMLADLNIAHDRVEPLRVSYRSTREIVDSALYVLGPHAADVRPVAPRRGAPVEAFAFGSQGECTDFLARALRDLVHSEPLASVALIARHPEQARLYYEALSAAEVPELRLVADQDFSFRAGIDVTDVTQTKGLEFDIVILLDVTEDSYPANDLSRRLLHVAMTRAAHQLWVTYTGSSSPLLPAALR
jgi:DNA helicase II / ATP-dependent DNA helicase PcrA